MSSDDSDTSDISPVIYGSAPNSPVQTIRYRGGEHSDEDIIPSPQKKPRIYRANARQPPKRQQKTTRTKHDIAEGAQHIEGEEWEAWDYDHTPEPTAPVDSTPTPHLEPSYNSFLESLEWDDSMFTQISEELFVVHGWNWRKNEATVCVPSHV